MAKKHLFDLIQSLSMSEKRFFKVFSSRHVIGNENDYVKLFDLIQRMDIYDESLVIKAKFIKNSSAEKNYLYRLVLKSLNAYHAQNSVRTKVYDYLISIEVLFQKGLYMQAAALVEKALKLAVENEMFRQQLVLTEIKQELLLKNQEYGAALKVFTTDFYSMDLVYNLMSLKELTTKGYNQNLAKGVVRENDDLISFKKLVKDTIVKNENQALSKRARLHQISVLLTYNMVAGSNTKVLKYAELILRHYESHAHLINTTPIGYVSSCFILGSAQIESVDKLGIQNTLKRIEKSVNYESVKKSQKAVSFAFFYKHILLIQLNRINGDEKTISYQLKEIEELITNHIRFITKPQLYDLYFQMALAYFDVATFKKSMKYTNEILNDLSFKCRDDFMNSVKLFNLIVHFELGNDFTLDYLSKSTYNYLKRKNRLFEVERTLIKFFTKHEINLVSKSAEYELKKIELKLIELKGDKFEKKAFQYFDYLIWIQSKLLKI